MRSLQFGLLAASLLTLSCSGLAIEGSYRSEAPTPPPPQTRKASSHPAHLGVPPGHLPPPGMCRVWFPGRPPGHQPPPTHCGEARHEAPMGAWVLYRPDRDKKRVHVSVYDASRPSVVVAIRYYDAVSGEFLYEGS